VQVLNSSAMTSGYASHDPQGGTTRKALCSFSFWVYKIKLGISS